MKISIKQQLQKQLHLAVREQYPDLVQIENLLTQGADFYAGLKDETQCYMPAISMVVCRNAVDILKVFINHRANVNFQDEGRSLLSIATWEGNVEIIKLLIQHGAKVNLHGNNLLSIASEKDDEDTQLVKFLVEMGARTDDVDIDGLSPLQTAFHYGKFGTAKILLEYETNANIKQNGIKILNKLVVHKDVPDKIELIKIILDKGVDVNARIFEEEEEEEEDYYRNFHYEKSYSDPLLKLAAYSGCIETVKLLIKNGAKYDHKWKVEEEGCWINMSYFEEEIKEWGNKNIELTNIYYAAEIADSISEGKEYISTDLNQQRCYDGFSDNEKIKLDQSLLDVVLERLRFNLVKYGIPHLYNNYSQFKSYVRYFWIRNDLSKELLKLITNVDGTGMIEKLEKSIYQNNLQNSKLTKHVMFNTTTGQTSSPQSFRNFSNHSNYYSSASNEEIMWNSDIDAYTLGGR